MVEKGPKNVKFDISIGLFDRAEACKLMGLFIQYILWRIIDKEYSELNKDSGLIFIENITGRKSDFIRKKLF